jgi:integrative and conjugative element protein (TIGR02256 family)
MTPGRRVTVTIRDTVLTELFAEADAQVPRETGGILMGRWQSPAVVHVTDAIGPGPRARHTRTSFRPDYDFQEAEIARIYRDTARTSTYLGDWHSHPGGVAAMSERDRATLERICTEPQARAETALMAILTSKLDWEISVWSGRVRGRFWKRLVVVPASVHIIDEDSQR